MTVKLSDKKTYVVANWKMNTLIEESVKLAEDIKSGLETLTSPEVIVCPPYLSLISVGEIIKDSSIKLGAQNVFWEDPGNYTGEIAPEMLKEVGVTHVIIGHSERRQNVGETDEMIDKKVAAAIRHQLTPLLCVGETAEERRQGVQHMVITDQVKKALRYIPPPTKRQHLKICYEPVWSIYPGQPCDPDQAKEIATVITQALIDIYPQNVVQENFTIIYGGSVTPENVANYVDREYIHGVLVGTASREPKTFLNIINNISAS
ncbi:triose-phosphate isomerase [Patescibacteria group bacterium]